jgi:hypothetical protein
MRPKQRPLAHAGCARPALYGSLAPDDVLLSKEKGHRTSDTNCACVDQPIMSKAKYAGWSPGAERRRKMGLRASTIPSGRRK